MLFEKVISLGYILQMVMEISRVSNHGTILSLIEMCIPLCYFGNEASVGSDPPKKFLLHVSTHRLMKTVFRG